MRQTAIALLILTLATLACRKASPCEVDLSRCTPTPISSPTASAVTATPSQALVIYATNTLTPSAIMPPTGSGRLATNPPKVTP